jgi:hypothetical protein
MYGIVVAVAPLPVSHRDMISLTSVRLRVEAGEEAYFFADSALAATLANGEWVEFLSEGRNSTFGTRLRVIAPSSALSALANAATEDAVYYWLQCLMLAAAAQKTPPAIVDSLPNATELQRYAHDVFQRLSHFRERFGLDGSAGSSMPDEVLCDLMPLSEVLTWYRHYLAETGRKR